MGPVEGMKSEECCPLSRTLCTVSSQEILDGIMSKGQVFDDLLWDTDLAEYLF